MIIGLPYVDTNSANFASLTINFDCYFCNIILNLSFYPNLLLHRFIQSQFAMPFYQLLSSIVSHLFNSLLFCLTNIYAFQQELGNQINSLFFFFLLDRKLEGCVVTNDTTVIIKVFE